MSVHKEIELGIILFKIKANLLGSQNIEDQQNHRQFRGGPSFYTTIAANKLSRTQTHHTALNHNADQNFV